MRPSSFSARRASPCYRCRYLPVPKARARAPNAGAPCLTAPRGRGGTAGAGLGALGPAAEHGRGLVRDCQPPPAGQRAPVAGPPRPAARLQRGRPGDGGRRRETRAGELGCHTDDHAGCGAAGPARWRGPVLRVDLRPGVPPARLGSVFLVLRTAKTHVHMLSGFRDASMHGNEVNRRLLGPFSHAMCACADVVFGGCRNGGA